jgi:malonyl-CoA/methylmalonyl-CoA synthetase
MRRMPGATDPADWLYSTAETRPAQVFVRTPQGRELSYAALREQVGRAAAALHARGVMSGDRVAVQVEKSLDAVLLYLGCLETGAVFVPINTANTPNEVEYFLRDAEPRMAVVRPADFAALEPVAERAGVLHLETLGVAGDGSWAELSGRSASPSRTPRSGGPESLAAIVYTSGTTGRSKGAMLTRGNLGSNAATLADAWHFTANDVLLHTLPLFHVHGLFAAVNTVLASGSGMLLLPKFDAVAVLAHLSAATVYMGVPTHYTRLLQERGLDRAATAGMRLFISGSAPLLAETHREFERRTGQVILERYGMTETVMITSNPYAGPRLPGSVGAPLPGVSLRIAAPVEGTGALEVKGPNVFAGYWRDPEKTRSEFTEDGWFKTGDLGRMDANGYVTIVGRAKDLVITGGYNVYPKEVESELNVLPGVRESAVFGVPHPDFGEGVTAALVVEPGCALAETEVVNALRHRLAGYKIPKRCVFVDELPRNTMGKVQKNVLRATYATLYGAPCTRPEAP